MSDYVTDNKGKIPGTNLRENGFLRSGFAPVAGIGGDQPASDMDRAMDALRNAFRNSAETAAFGEKLSLVDKYAANAEKSRVMDMIRENFGPQRAAEMFRAVLAEIQAEPFRQTTAPVPARPRAGISQQFGG